MLDFDLINLTMTLYIKTRTMGTTLLMLSFIYKYTEMTLTIFAQPYVVAEFGGGYINYAFDYSGRQVCMFWKAVNSTLAAVRWQPLYLPLCSTWSCSARGPLLLILGWEVPVARDTVFVVVNEFVSGWCLL